jgi:hypothetical protein
MTGTSAAEMELSMNGGRQWRRMTRPRDPTS